jgi:gp16 family phage-associated protein
MKQAAQEQQKVYTREEVRAAFQEHGVTIDSWASAHGFPVQLVKDVLLGRTQGKYGKAHEIAVALNLKAKPRERPAFLRKVA